jgi:protein-tyrosine-phosphatase
MLQRLVDGVVRRVSRLVLRRKAFRLHVANATMLDTASAPSCLYLCYGNIMRSPFAAKVAAAQRPDLRIGGGGFHANTGRTCPDACLATARTFEVDLEPHRSRLVTADDVQRYDIIFVTDLRVLGLLLSQFPTASRKVLMLGLLGDTPSVEIPDPWGHEPEVVQACYRRIFSAVSLVSARARR